MEVRNDWIGADSSQNPPPSFLGSGGVGGSKTTSGIYASHSYTSPGNFIVTNATGGSSTMVVRPFIVGGGGGGGAGDAPLSVEYLVVGGGGGGASAAGPGGPSIEQQLPNNSKSRLILSLLEAAGRWIR